MIDTVRFSSSPCGLRNIAIHHKLYSASLEYPRRILRANGEDSVPSIKSTSIVQSVQEAPQTLVFLSGRTTSQYQFGPHLYAKHTMRDQWVFELHTRDEVVRY
jgi:hypothetical protein